MELDEVQAALLELVQAGKACASTRIGENGRRIFVAVEHATDEDRRFTQVWVRDPHFGIQ